MLRRRYPDESTASIAQSLGRSVSSVYNAAFVLGLKKSPGYLASAQSGRIGKLTHGGRRHQFAKGHNTWNAGKKGWQAGGRSAQTQFRQGQMPHNWRSVGSERTDADGILWRKVSDTRNRKQDWKAVHVMEWEAANGPLPRDRFVIFADGNHRNYNPKNLLAVTRAENMQRNSYHRYPKELARLIQLRGALNRQINKREKHEDY